MATLLPSKTLPEPFAVPPAAESVAKLHADRWLLDMCYQTYDGRWVARARRGNTVGQRTNFELTSVAEDPRGIDYVLHTVLLASRVAAHRHPDPTVSGVPSSELPVVSAAQVADPFDLAPPDPFAV